MARRRPSFWEDDASDPSGQPTREVEPAGGPLAPGSRVGRWEVEAQLGEGGMSRVYRCRAGELSAAVKVFMPDVADPHAEAAFLRESGLLAKVRHPNVVRVLETGRLDDDRPWMALQLVPGRPLSELGRLTERRAVPLLEQALEALGAVHDAGLVHRDVKPENLLVERGGGLTLLDFGIARVGEQVAPTSTTEVRGTLDFMSPEQLEGRATGPQSDLYSLGCVAWWMLAGGPPFAGTLREQLAARLEGAVAPPGAGRKLGEWIVSLLEPEPRRRPSSAATALARLRGQP